MRNNQKWIFLILLIATALITTFAYHVINKSQVIFRKAETCFNEKEFSTAIPFYNEAIKQGLKTTEVFTHRADSFMATEDFLNALESYEYILQENMTNLAAIKNCSALYSYFGRVDEAIMLYKQYEKTAALDTESLINLADLYKYKKEYDTSERTYREVLKLHTELLSVNFKLAELLSWNKRYNESVELYKVVLKREPQNRVARIHLARVLAWSGKLDEAVLEYKKALGENI